MWFAIKLKFFCIQNLFYEHFAKRTRAKLPNETHTEKLWRVVHICSSFLAYEERANINNINNNTITHKTLKTIHSVKKEEEEQRWKSVPWRLVLNSIKRRKLFFCQHECNDAGFILMKALCKILAINTTVNKKTRLMPHSASISNHEQGKTPRLCVKYMGMYCNWWIYDTRYLQVHFLQRFVFSGPCFEKIVIWHVLVKIKNDEIKKNENNEQEWALFRVDLNRAFAKKWHCIFWYMPFGLAHGPIKPNRIRFHLISTFHSLFIVSQMQCIHLMGQTSNTSIRMPKTVHYANTCWYLCCCWRMRCTLQCIHRKRIMAEISLAAVCTRTRQSCLALLWW